MKKEQDYLIAKADGVKDCVKWLEKGMKDRKANGDGVGDLLEIKISLDKYRRKLLHEASETDGILSTDVDQCLFSVHQVFGMINLINQGKADDAKLILEKAIEKSATG